MRMTIEIIDNTTGRPPSAKLIDRIAKEYGLMEMDIDQFAVTEDGHVVLIDDCGRYSYVDTEGFNLRINFCEVEDEGLCHTEVLELISDEVYEDGNVDRRNSAD